MADGKYIDMREVYVGNSSLSRRRLLFCEKRSPPKHKHCRRIGNLAVAEAAKNRSNFDDRRLVVGFFISDLIKSFLAESRSNAVSCLSLAQLDLGMILDAFAIC
ncbi:unnamed protein product [Ilex paraguariensis]|uniref:Uncharacterized protein n=1 Tax=Ilex paraguariensis TaxID=185542 RepID=A0ABC8RSG9_9AQUA